MPYTINTQICYAFLNGAIPGNRIIVIKYNNSGYWPSSLDKIDFSNDQAKAIIQKENEKLGVPDNVASSMLYGSMFGWNIPKANEAHKFWNTKT